MDFVGIGKTFGDKKHPRMNNEGSRDLSDTSYRRKSLYVAAAQFWGRQCYICTHACQPISRCGVGRSLMNTNRHIPIYSLSGSWSRAIFLYGP